MRKTPSPTPWLRPHVAQHSSWVLLPRMARSAPARLTNCSSAAEASGATFVLAQGGFALSLGDSLTALGDVRFSLQSPRGHCRPADTLGSPGRRAPKHLSGAAVSFRGGCEATAEPRWQ